jgi:hypothetical protein
MLRMAAAGLALTLAVSRAQAAFEPALFSPRAAALGGAMTAVQDDPAAQLYNPATLGTLETPAASLNYHRQFHVPAGETNQDFFDILGGIPVKQEVFNGGFGLQILYNRQFEFARERSVGLGYGTRSLWVEDDRRLDFGGSVRTLKKTIDAGGNSPTRLGLDAGLLYRWGERYALGFSLLNFNGPALSHPAGRDRAPAEARLGFSESLRGYTVSLDLAKREPSLNRPGTAEAAAGLERWWPTARHGSFAARTGLSLGDREKTWSWGFGWKVLGAELQYAMTVPMRGVSILGNAIGLTFRFGQANPEAEYEKVLAGEIRYRKDLVEALQAGEIKQWKLAEELLRLRQEMDALRRKLAASKTNESDTRQRMQEIEDRHRRAQETFERLKKDSESVKGRTQQSLFDDDWSAYQRLKNSGAPETVLVDTVKRLLQQYKESGVDLAEANQELVRLLRSR